MGRGQLRRGANSGVVPAVAHMELTCDAHASKEGGIDEYLLCIRLVAAKGVDFCVLHGFCSNSSIKGTTSTHFEMRRQGS